MRELIDQSLYEYINEMNLAFDFEKAKANILEFFKGRIKNMLQDEKIRYDIIEGIIQDGDKVHLIFKKAEELDPWFRKQEDHHFIDAFLRLHNLSLKASKKGRVDEELFQEEEEKELYQAFKLRKSKIQELIDSHEFVGAIEKLEELVEEINNYFDHVMVMTDNEVVRENRLNMIAEIDAIMEQILDIEKIVTE